MKPGARGPSNSLGPQIEQHEILDGERDAEGREQLEQFRRLVDATQQDDLDQRSDRGDDDRGEGDRAPEADRAAQPIREREADVGAQHEERAMREIDDAGDAKDDREAGSDQKQRAGAREAGDELDEVEAQLEGPAKKRAPSEA